MRPRVPLRQQALYLPNLLTYLRILAVPAIMGIMQDGSPTGGGLAAVVFGVAALTDAVDGWIARRLNQVSVLGELLDPLADKLIVAGPLIMLVGLGRVSAWLVFLVIGREMFVTGLRAIAASEGLVIAARNMGKQKTAFQMVAIWCLLVHHQYPLFGGDVSFHRIGFFCLVISLYFSLASAWDYVRSFARVVAAAPSEQDQGRG